MEPWLWLCVIFYFLPLGNITTNFAQKFSKNLKMVSYWEERKLQTLKISRWLEANSKRNGWIVYLSSLFPWTLIFWEICVCEELWQLLSMGGLVKCGPGKRQFPFPAGWAPTVRGCTQLLQGVTHVDGVWHSPRGPYTCGVQVTVHTSSPRPTSPSSRVSPCYFPWHLPPPAVLWSVYLISHSFTICLPSKEWQSHPKMNLAHCIHCLSLASGTIAGAIAIQ